MMTDRSEGQSQHIQVQSNEMLSRLDNLPFSKWHIFITIALGLVWIFDGYEVSLISLYRNEIVEQFSEETYKGLVSGYQLGCIVGSLIFGVLSFVIGRKQIFVITLLIYFVGVVLSGVETNSTLFILARFLTGLSVGGQFTAIFTCVDEFLPPTHRGRVNIAIDGTWHLGGSVAALLTMLIGQTDHWRVLFLVGVIGIVFLGVIRRNVPQSPRWLLVKNRGEEALIVIQTIQQAVLNNNCMLQPRAGAVQQQSTLSTNPNHPHPTTCRMHLFQILNVIRSALLTHTKKFLVAFTLIFWQSFFFSSVYYRYPGTLADKGLNQAEVSAYMLPLSVCSFVSTLFVGTCFDKIGRRFMLLITYCSSGVMLLFTYMITSQLILLEIFTVGMFFMASPASSSANLIASQIFPTSGRTIMLFVMFIFSMLGGMAGVWIDSYWVSGSMMIVAGIVGWLFCPPSENKSLEQIEHL